MCFGDPFAMLNVHTPGYDQPSVRSWWPSSEEEWLAAKPYGYWGVADVGLTAEAWSRFPRLSANRLGPHSFSLGNAELLINFPDFVAFLAAVQSFAKTRVPPPPSPSRPESFWGRGAGPANNGYQRGEEEESQAPTTGSALRVPTGDAMIGSFQGYQ